MSTSICLKHWHGCWCLPVRILQSNVTNVRLHRFPRHSPCLSPLLPAPPVTPPFVHVVRILVVKRKEDYHRCPATSCHQNSGMWPRRDRPSRTGDFSLAGVASVALLVYELTCDMLTLRRLGEFVWFFFCSDEEVLSDGGGANNKSIVASKASAWAWELSPPAGPG
mmetsp:Transcript_544/g.1294  ORF Transcript_544/g.1294 Transcript_544/m.1294 type:complete len:166 (+) Transcript_544:183-680(+)|eukprot:CAMPEP_0116863830 /NCGR_PEP_ID=MMETSP0418-20121206/24462_1 /TAXON_ID=1158023 /ORGANISM="Astrosyne radiata, Strain 13vi08-1A" /LENGTH=165 /DNA_ID=CAMNT_0004498939 /DNA_START=131 /DNA_END=628 /DNA_ORIENTATION=+